MEPARPLSPPSPNPISNAIVSKEKLVEPSRLAARQRQIDIGKNTAVYERYITAVPKRLRDPALRFTSHPVTPDKFCPVSKRAFDGRVRVWRRLLFEAWATDEEKQRLTTRPSSMAPALSASSCNPTNEHKENSSSPLLSSTSSADSPAECGAEPKCGYDDVDAEALQLANAMLSGSEDLPACPVLSFDL